jgi:hypothetical protein
VLHRVRREEEEEEVRVGSDQILLVLAMVEVVVGIIEVGEGNRCGNLKGVDLLGGRVKFLCCEGNSIITTT